MGWFLVRCRHVRAAWLLPVLFAACGGKTEEPTAAELCPQICEKAKKCPGAPAVASCDDLCLGEDATAEATGCRDQYEESERCLADLDDVCTGNKACATSIKATQACEVAYCVKHPQDDVCVVPTQ